MTREILRRMGLKHLPPTEYVDNDDDEENKVENDVASSAETRNPKRKTVCVLARTDEAEAERLAIESTLRSHASLFDISVTSEHVSPSALRESRLIVVLTRRILQCPRCQSIIERGIRDDIPMVFIMVLNNDDNDDERDEEAKGWSWEPSGTEGGFGARLRSMLTNIEILTYRSPSRMYEHVAMLRESMRRFRYVGRSK